MSFRQHQPTRLVVVQPNDEPWDPDATLWPLHDPSPGIAGPSSNVSWRSEYSENLERATVWREDVANQLNEQSQEWKLSSREEAAIRRASVSYAAAQEDSDEEGEKWPVVILQSTFLDWMAWISFPRIHVMLCNVMTGRVRPARTKISRAS